MPSNIMVVEDNELVRESLMVWLKMAFPCTRIQPAGSGEQAVSLAEKLSYDLVLMDLGLPQMNGIEATRSIKSFTPETCVVVLSIQEDPQYVQEALEAGASAYVTKRKMHADLIPTVTGLLSDSPKASGDKS